MDGWLVGWMDGWMGGRKEAKNCYQHWKKRLFFPFQVDAVTFQFRLYNLLIFSTFLTESGEVSICFNKHSFDGLFPRIEIVSFYFLLRVI
jgi:hypothetical protein